MRTILVVVEGQVCDHALETGILVLDALPPALTGEVLINSLDADITGPDLTRAAYSEGNYRRAVVPYQRATDVRLPLIAPSL